MDLIVIMSNCKDAGMFSGDNCNTLDMGGIVFLNLWTFSNGELWLFSSANLTCFFGRFAVFRREDDDRTGDNVADDLDDVDDDGDRFNADFKGMS